MGIIYKRERVWYVDLRVNGRRVRKRIGPSKEIALLALKDAEVKAARQEFGFARTDITIGKFLDQFAEYSKTHHQPNTTKRYKAVMDHFQSFLKDSPEIVFVSQITPALIDRYAVYRKSSWVNPNGDPITSDDDVTVHTRQGARAHTINFEVGTLRTMLNMAIKWGFLRDNPTRQVVKLKVSDSKPTRFLTKEECQHFLKACPTELYRVYFTFLNTGMRKAELEHLEWSDVDLKRRKIRIQRKEDWQPKTGERDIPMNDGIHQLLSQLQKENARKIKSRFVFCSPDGSKLRTKLREKLITIAKRAGIENLTRVHTLRHTFASHLVMNGVDLPTVKKLMGHADIQTTMIYAHLAADHLADAVNKLPF